MTRKRKRSPLRGLRVRRARGLVSRRRRETNLRVRDARRVGRRESSPSRSRSSRDRSVPQRVRKPRGGRPRRGHDRARRMVRAEWGRASGSRRAAAVDGRSTRIKRSRSIKIDRVFLDVFVDRESRLGPFFGDGEMRLRTTVRGGTATRWLFAARPGQRHLTPTRTTISRRKATTSVVVTSVAFGGDAQSGGCVAEEARSPNAVPPPRRDRRAKRVHRSIGEAPVACACSTRATGRFQIAVLAARARGRRDLRGFSPAREELAGQMGGADGDGRAWASRAPRRGCRGGASTRSGRHQHTDPVRAP